STGGNTLLASCEVHGSDDAATGGGHELGDLGEYCNLCAGLHNRGSNRVFGTQLNGCGGNQNVVGGAIIRGEDVGDGHLTFGDGTGFVQDDSVNTAGIFQHLWSTDQDAHL